MVEKDFILFLIMHCDSLGIEMYIFHVFVNLEYFFPETEIFNVVLFCFPRDERDRFYKKLYTTSTLPLRVVLVTHGLLVIPRVSTS